MDANHSQQLRPFIKWAGGKRAVMDHLEKRFPKHFNNYYEPFLGGGAVLMHLQSTRQIKGTIFASDISEPLIITYKTIQNHVQELITLLKTPEYKWESQTIAREKFLLHRDRFNRLKLQAYASVAVNIAKDHNITVDTLFNDVIDKISTKPSKELIKAMTSGKDKQPLESILTDQEKIEMAALFIFLNKVGFNGMYRENGYGLYNIPPGKTATAPTIFDEELIRNLSTTWRENDVRFTCCNFTEALQGANKGNFVYLDPPYDVESIPKTTKSTKASDAVATELTRSAPMFTAYTGNTFGEREQIALRAAFVELDKRGCYVMTSNAATDRVKQLYDAYRVEEIDVKRCINSKGDDRKKTVHEVIITNTSS